MKPEAPGRWTMSTMELPESSRKWPSDELLFTNSDEEKMRTPSQIAKHLASVVERINNSKQPARSLVANELRRTANELDPTTPSQLFSQACMRLPQGPKNTEEATNLLKQYCTVHGIDQTLCTQAIEFAKDQFCPGGLYPPY